MEGNVKFEESKQESKQIDLKKSIIATCRQFTALLPGYLLLLVSGIHIGWGSFNPNLKSERWTWSQSDLMINFVISSYYFGVFFGVLTGRSWFKTGTKAYNYQISATLCIITSIVLITSPEVPIQIIIARLLAGFGIGLGYLTWMMQCEILPSHSRGILLSFSHFFIYIGVFAAVIITFIGHEVLDDPLDGKLRIIGAVIFVLSGGAMVGTFKLFRESPAYLIRQGNSDAALVCLLELRNETEVTREIETEFKELELMVQEDDKLGPSIVTQGNIKPLILISVVAAISLASFNYPINMIRLNTFAKIEFELLVFIGILIIIRIVFGVIACNLCDILGRRKIQLISGCSSGVVLIVLGIILCTKVHISSTISILIFIVYELNSTLGVSSITAVLMFEAFPLTKRSSSVTTILAFESLIHIILISITFDIDMTPVISGLILFGFGGLMIGLSVYLRWKLPETMGLTMRQARDEYRIQK